MTPPIAPIPKKVAERIAEGLKAFQPILAAAKAEEVGETDTVTIVKDMLADVFGYDKYSELTSEFCIRGTFCDLAIKLDAQITALIEVKAIGIVLKEKHVKQAVGYATNEGVDWVILTNGIRWCVYHVFFTKPITQELVVDIDFTTLKPKSESAIETLFLWSKEGLQRSSLDDFHTQKQAVSRFFLSAIVLSDPVLEVVRRELRRVSPDVRTDIEQIRAVLESEVVNREVMDDDKFNKARKKIARTAAAARSAASEQEAIGLVQPETPAASTHSTPTDELPDVNANGLTSGRRHSRAVSYFILQNETAKGPFTISELLAMQNLGTITPETLYCQEGFPAWLPLRAVIS